LKVKEFNAKKVFSEASGTCAIVDDKIKMILNEYGLYEEVIDRDDDFELDQIIEYVSPNLNTLINETDIANRLYAEIQNIKYDKRIGYYLSTYVGYVIEEDYRENASSGGMGTWIFKELFDNDLIDGVIHVKKNPDENSPVLFQYDISRSITEIKAGAKTRYYPVEMSQVLRIVKEVPGRYAVIGIPSFIMAIRLLSDKDEVIKDRIKFTIGLICGHQKSSKFAEAMAWQMGIKPLDLHDIDFRKKLPQNNAGDYGIEITGVIDHKEVTVSKSAKSLIGQDWGQGYFKSLASDYTDDVMNETADITLGDAWLPEYIEDSKGNNIVIVRNPIIEALIKEGVKSKRINLDIVNVETIFRSQSAHYRHTHDELAYRLYKYDKLKKWRPTKRVKPSRDISLLRKRVQDLRADISSKSHIVYQEAVALNDLDHFMKEMSLLSNNYNRLYKLMAIQKLGLLGIFKAVLSKTTKIFFKD